MSFFALLAALLLEYFRPLRFRFRVYAWFNAYARLLERQFNAGAHRHGVLAWVLGVAPLALAVALGGYLMGGLGSLPEWAWSVAILYLVMGFKQFSGSAAGIAASLRAEALDDARRQLGQWTGSDASSLSATEVARRGIEETLANSYTQLFGVMLWFAVFGPGGAVLYRLAQIVGRKWGRLDEREFGEFGVFAVRVQGWMEWLPLRLTAISFAVMGDFEDAMYCWRSQAEQWAQQGMGIVLAAGAGALGVKLGEGESGNELGLGDVADADYLDSSLSLVWRVLILWLVLLFLFGLARWTSS